MRAKKKKQSIILGPMTWARMLTRLDAQFFMAIPRIHLGTRRFLTPCCPSTIPFLSNLSIYFPWVSGAF